MLGSDERATRRAPYRRGGALRSWQVVGALLATMVVWAPAAPHAQTATERLNQVRAIHLVDHAESLGSARKLGTCLMEKLQEQGPFTFPETRDGADALLTLESHVPSGVQRGLFGRSPEVRAVLTTPDGTVLWEGENKYRKSTTIWGGTTDIECGLANGLVDKLVRAIDDASSMP